MDEPSRASSTTTLVVEPSARTYAITTAFVLFGFGGQAVRNLVGWPGFVIASLVLLVLAAQVLMAARPTLRMIPTALIAFLAVCSASILWSEYHWTTIIALAAQFATTAAGIAIGVTLSREALLRVLSWSFSLLVAGSLLFEVLVTTVVGHRFAPFFTERRGDLPGAFYWSENRLLEGGPIQGIVGNRNLLAFIALLAIIAVVMHAMSRGRVSRLDIASLVLSAAAMALTRSATVIVAMFAVGAMALAIAILRRLRADRRSTAIGAASLVTLGTAIVAWPHRELFLGFLGRTDLTNRADVWRTVASIAEQHPLLGIGWTSYWAPWAKPFQQLVVIDGVQYLQAHNALLDVWLQLGFVGVAAALWLAFWTLRRAGRESLDTSRAFALSVAPLLFVVALFMQSLTESRLLVEGNWMLLAALGVHLAISHQRRLAETVGSAVDDLRRVGDRPRPIRSSGIAHL